MSPVDVCARKGGRMNETDAIRRIIANVGPEPKSFDTALEVRPALAELDALESVYKALEEVLFVVSGCNKSGMFEPQERAIKAALAKARGES